jgi:hypothetical protein
MKLHISSEIRDAATEGNGTGAGLYGGAHSRINLGKHIVPYGDAHPGSGGIGELEGIRGPVAVTGAEGAGGSGNGDEGIDLSRSDGSEGYGVGGGRSSSLGGGSSRSCGISSSTLELDIGCVAKVEFNIPSKIGYSTTNSDCGRTGFDGGAHSRINLGKHIIPYGDAHPGSGGIGELK